MKRVFFLLTIVFLFSCSIDSPANISLDFDWNKNDTNGDGIENEISYTATIENTGGERAVGVEVGVYVIYPNSREQIDDYNNNLYAGDKAVIEGYYEVGAKDVRDVIIERE